MKNLILIRHAHAEFSAPNGKPDFYRALSKKGIQEADFMTNIVVGKLPKPEIVLSSSALRAMQTAEIFQNKLFNRHNIQPEKLIYEADAKELLDFIKELPNNAQTVWLFGHEPKLTEIILSLSFGFDKTMSTCSIAFLKFDCISWMDISRKNIVSIQHNTPSDFK